MLVFVMSLLLFISACTTDDSNPKEQTCEEGYELVDGECEEEFIPATECGEGEILVLGYCVEDPYDKNPSGEVPTPVEVCKGVDYTYDKDNLNYQLVWSDEFDGTELDETKWRYEINGSGGGNNELQYYTDQNATVSDGFLQITARKEEYLGRDYTSSRITSREEWTYGIMEIRAKMPSGRGTWPAIWMMPRFSRYGGWPNSGEIDITEHVGYDPLKVHSTVHTEKFNHKLNTQKGGSTTILDPTSNFHTYKIEWLPDRILFYVNDYNLFTYKASNYGICPDAEIWPFDHDFFLILNVAIGGDWGGVQGVDTNIFPTTMVVDYVRVYQSDIITNLEQDVIEE